MVDVINSKYHLPQAEIPANVWNGTLQPFDLKDLRFFPKDDFSYRATKGSMKAIGLGNLFCSITDGRAAIFNLSNSLHKVCHGGINYTDFTRSQIIDVSDWIGDTLNYNFNGSELWGRFEFGVNIEVKDPALYTNAQNNFKGYLPENMKRGNKAYGNKFDAATFDIKAYNPIKKMQLNNENLENPDLKIIRFEKVMRIGNLRKNGIDLRNVKDLSNKDILAKLGKSLYNSAKQIKLIMTLPEDANYKDLYILHLFQNMTLEQRKNFRKTKSSTYNRFAKRYKILQKMYKPEKLDISEKIKDKWFELLES